MYSMAKISTTAMVDILAMIYTMAMVDIRNHQNARLRITQK